MWRHYNDFYHCVLKAEISLTHQFTNIHDFGRAQKFVVSCTKKGYSTTKEALLHVSGLQLVFNRKSKLILSKNAKAGAKVTRCLGSGVKLKKNAYLQFWIHTHSTLLGGMAATSFLTCKSTNNAFLVVPSVALLNRLVPQAFKFKKVTPFQVFFVFCTSYDSFSLLRYLKFPIKNY